MEFQPTVRPARRRLLLAVVVFALFSLPVAALAVVISSNVYFLEADARETEDVYVAANSARVFGTVDGDFLVAAGDVTIAGVVTGDLVVATQGRLTIDGEVRGSVRALARDVVVTGTVGDDIAAVAFAVDVAGDVGRDLLLVAGSVDLTGKVTRDLLGRVQDASLDGAVGGDVDLLLSRLTLGSDLEVSGDIVYRSSDDATVSSGAEIAGTLSKLPSRGSFIVRSVLLFVTLIHFLSFLFTGLVLTWLFRPTMTASVSQVMDHPWRSIGVGAVTFVLLPLIVVVLVFSLVGIPIGLLLLLLMLLGLFFAPIPAVTAVGFRLLRGRGALFGGFLVGALIWRGAIWLIPLVAVVVYLLSAVAGLGGFVLAIRERRRSDHTEELVAPGAVRPGRGDVESDTIREEWVAPLAPRRSGEMPASGAVDGAGDGATDTEAGEEDEA